LVEGLPESGREAKGLAYKRSQRYQPCKYIFNILNYIILLITLPTPKQVAALQIQMPHIFKLFQDHGVGKGEGNCLVF